MGVERQIPEDLKERYDFAKTVQPESPYRDRALLEISLIERIADHAAEVETLRDALKAWVEWEAETSWLSDDETYSDRRRLVAQSEEALTTDQQLQPKGEPVKRGWSEYMKKYGREEYGLDEEQPKGEPHKCACAIENHNDVPSGSKCCVCEGKLRTEQR